MNHLLLDVLYFIQNWSLNMISHDAKNDALLRALKKEKKSSGRITNNDSWS